MTSFIAWRIVAPVAVALGLNLNWIFDPLHAWRKGETFRQPRHSN